MSDKKKVAVIEEVLLENYNQYYRLAYSYVKNEADAMDIVQNGAYKAILHCSQLKQDAFAKTWVYRIMLNEVFRFLKKPTLLSTDEALYEEGVTDPYVDFDLKQALDALNEEDKLVITLRYFEDMKLEDIAAIQDVSVSTIKSRLYRGLKKLRVKLED